MKTEVVGTVIQVGKGRCLLVSDGIEHDVEVADESTQRALGGLLHKPNAVRLELDLTTGSGGDTTEWVTS